MNFHEKKRIRTREELAHRREHEPRVVLGGVEPVLELRQGQLAVMVQIRLLEALERGDGRQVLGGLDLDAHGAQRAHHVRGEHHPVDGREELEHLVHGDDAVLVGVEGVEDRVDLVLLVALAEQGDALRSRPLDSELQNTKPENWNLHQKDDSPAAP